MNWGGPGFVLAIIAMVMGAKIITTMIRARHGYQMEDGGRRDRHGGSDDLAAHRKAELLAGETERLKGQVSRLEERIAVLERIATDAPSRLAREIDELR